MTDAGLVNIALREWSTRSGHERDRLMRSLLGIRLELSLVGVVCGALFTRVAGYAPTLVIGTIIAGLGMMLQTTANVLTVSLQGELRFGWVTIVDITRQAVAVALIVALVIAGAGLLPFLAVTIPAGAVTLVFTAVLVRRDMPLWPSFAGFRLVADASRHHGPVRRGDRAEHAVLQGDYRRHVADRNGRQTGYFATSFQVTEVLVGVPATRGRGCVSDARAGRSKRIDKRFAYAADRIIELALSRRRSPSCWPWCSSHRSRSASWRARRGAPAVPVLQIQGPRSDRDVPRRRTSYPPARSVGTSRC